jgi:hypothetical protein
MLHVRHPGGEPLGRASAERSGAGPSTAVCGIEGPDGLDLVPEEIKPIGVGDWSGKISEGRPSG